MVQLAYLHGHLIYVKTFFYVVDFFKYITWINVLLKSIFLVEASLFGLLRMKKKKKKQHIASSRNGINDRCWLDPWSSELSSDSLWTCSLQNPTHNTHKSAKVKKKMFHFRFLWNFWKFHDFYSKGKEEGPRSFPALKPYYLSDV